MFQVYCSSLTGVPAAFAERRERSFGLGGPVAGAGAEGAGGQGLGEVVRAHLLGVVGGRFAPVCRRERSVRMRQKDQQTNRKLSL